MGVSKNRGTPKWMVYKGSNPIRIDDFGETHLFLETPISFPGFPKKDIPNHPN